MDNKTLIAALEHQVDQNGEDEELVSVLTNVIATLEHQTQLLASQDTIITALKQSVPTVNQTENPVKNVV